MKSVEHALRQALVDLKKRERLRVFTYEAIHLKIKSPMFQVYQQLIESFYYSKKKRHGDFASPEALRVAPPLVCSSSVRVTDFRTAPSIFLVRTPADNPRFIAKGHALIMQSKINILLGQSGCLRSRHVKADKYDF